MKRARQDRQQASAVSGTQPGFPTGEARLLDIRQEAGSVHLVLDTGHSFELAPGSVPAGLPACGEVVPGPLLQEIALGAERKQIARRVFAQLDRRLVPTAKLRERLVERGHSLAAIEAVLAQMRAQGVYSDRSYAQAYCRDCLLSRKVGRRYLVQKLRDRQIEPGLAQEVAGEILDRSTEAELALSAASDCWRRMRGGHDYKALAKVVRFLVSRGFEVGLANEAARRALPPAERTED